jgi:hypothetical protein
MTSIPVPDDDSMSDPLFDRLNCFGKFLVAGPVSTVHLLDVSIDLVTDITCLIDQYVGHLPIAPERHNIMAQSVDERFDELGSRIRVMGELGEVGEQR